MVLPASGWVSWTSSRDDLPGGIELAAFLAGAVREELDEVLVGRAEKIGELEVVVDEDEPGLAEVVEQVFPLLV